MNWATLKGLTIPEGVVTQIADSMGRVIWSGLKELITGTLTLRPSADIYVGHFAHPANSGLSAYQHINEEVSDGSSLYITTQELNGIYTATSKFKLSNTTPFSGQLTSITSVNIMGVGKNDDAGVNEFKLEVNGVETVAYAGASNNKAFDILVSDASVLSLINEYLAVHKVLPDINITITSQSTTGDKGMNESGVTQVYVVLAYEGY